MMHPKKLRHRQHDARVPRKHRKGREDDAKHERGEKEDRDTGVTLGERASHLDAVVGVSALGEGAAPGTQTAA
jgi:hypothetical protein